MLGLTLRSCPPGSVILLSPAAASMSRPRRPSAPPLPRPLLAHHSEPPACGSAMIWAALTALVALALLLLWQATVVQGCTTIVVGRKATVDGSVMVTHNNDCEDCDVRIGIVPEIHLKEGETAECNIQPCGFSFPRYVGPDRGEMYMQDRLALMEGLVGPDGGVWTAPETKPLGSIPQVAHTYRYIDGSYGMMNSAQLAIGESTCAAKIVAYSIAQGGDALFEASALTRLAMQRCSTARCAVDLMGSLAEEYGFAGSDEPAEDGDALFEIAGEALTIIDTTEAWVMHLLADPSGRSAVWAAQKLPEDHVAVVPNKFVIDAMNLSDSENFRASKDINRVAIEAGFLSKDLDRERGGPENFHFSEAFALDFADDGTGRNAGEAERRRWRIFSLVAPSRGFAQDPDRRERYPFSVRAESALSARDLQTLMRDHFEGTPYDQTKGLAAGPYGNPNRYDRNSEQQPKVRKGFFERTISIHRTSYSFVAQAKAPEIDGDEEEPKEGGNASSASWKLDHPNGFGGVLWFAHHSPQNSLYLPLYASSRSLPSSFGRGSLYRLDRDSAWWAFCAVANNAERMYSPIHGHIAALQNQVETESAQQVRETTQRAEKLRSKGRHEEALELVTAFTVEHNAKLVARWWQLLDEITVLFRDGMLLQSPVPPLQLQHLFYPVWWLRAVGYFEKGGLSDPTYPPLPRPAHAAAAAAPVIPTGLPAPASASSAVTPPISTAANVAAPAGAMAARASASSRPTLLVDKDQDTSSWGWLSSRRYRTPLALFLLAVVLVLLSLVCFQFGKYCMRRQAYRELTDQEDEDLPAGAEGYGSRGGLSRTGPRVVLTTR